MSDGIQVRRRDESWQPSRIPGVAFREMHPGEKPHAGTYLVRMDPGIAYPAHRHPGGEEVFVISGSMRVGGERLAEGDYLYTPPGGAHDASTEEGCTFFVLLPEPVEFL